MSNTVPTECGKCWKCGNTLYLGLTHTCSTAVNLAAKSATVVVPRELLDFIFNEWGATQDSGNMEFDSAMGDLERLAAAAPGEGK